LRSPRPAILAMSDPISGISRDAIATLGVAVMNAKNEHSTKTYFSVETDKEDAAAAVGLSKDGGQWFIQTDDTGVIEQIKDTLSCDVVDVLLEQAADDSLDVYRAFLAKREKELDKELEKALEKGSKA
jgi:hypothetical protein